MKINEFNETLCGELRERLGKSFEVRIFKKDNLNGVPENTICIHKEESISAPCIRTGAYYEQYQKGTIIIEEILDNIYHEFLAAEQNFPFADKLDGISSWEKAKNFIMPRLINSKRNKELLCKIPSIPFCDLSIVFYLRFQGGEEGINAGIPITKQLMERFGKDENALYEQALKNLEQSGTQVMSITGMMLQKKEFEGIPTEELSEMQDFLDNKMYVLTNKGCYFGAAVILLDSVKKKLAQIFKTDVYILPSSVHELICCPAENDVDREELLQMVHDVNRDFVLKEEWLSDSVYMFNRSEYSVKSV